MNCDVRTGAAEKHRRHIGLWIAISAVAIVIIVAAAGYGIRQIRATRAPEFLIKHGTPFERLEAAADLSVLKEDTDIDRVMAVLLGAMDGGDVVMRSTCEEGLGFLIAQMKSRPVPAHRRNKKNRAGACRS